MTELRNNNSRTVLIAIVGVLILLNGVFIFNYFTTDKKLVLSEQKLVKTETARLELQKLLDEAEAQINEYKGKNAKLDAMLSEKIKELEEKAEQIRNLLKKDKISQADLAKAKEEIDVLRYYKKKYLTQIDSLSYSVANLKDENVKLSTDVQTEKEKAENLAAENAKLGNIVALAGKLKTENLRVETMSVSDKGKEKETRRSANVERVKILFNLGENPVTEKGSKVMYMKIISPEGSTISTESGGSFTYQGQETSYTSKSGFNYDNTKQLITLIWDVGSTKLSKGNYKVELYCEGFQIGTSTFSLK